MAHCRVLLCNIYKKSLRWHDGFLSISNKDLVTFQFSLAIFLWRMINILKIENLKLVSERFLKMYIQFRYADTGQRQ